MLAVNVISSIVAFKFREISVMHLTIDVTYIDISRLKIFQKERKIESFITMVTLK